MKKLSLALSVAVLCGGLSALAQDARSGAARPHVADADARTVQLVGRVSQDAQSLVSDDQDRWTVSNPQALSSYRGRWVLVKCQLSADQSAIHVVSVHSGESTAAARPSDAAFRR